MPRPHHIAAILLMAVCLSTPTSGLAAAEVVSPEDRAVSPAIPTGPAQSFVDLDQLAPADAPWTAIAAPGEWACQVLPRGLIYENYLAGTKESRMSTNFINTMEDGWVNDSTLGARVGILRYGTFHPVRPEGFQIDVEGSAQLRLDLSEHRDLRSVDFRGGIPISYGTGRSRWKFGYYHTSAHAGDEFLLKNPGFERLNFSRDVLILGNAYYLTPQTRLYGEVGWAFYSDVTEPWEFQFGIDSAPVEPTGAHGAPFWAVNGHLRQEVDFGGSLTAQVGWAWRSDFGSSLLRAGFHYFNGKSNQYSFFDDHEQQLGLALWYDF